MNGFLKLLGLVILISGTIVSTLIGMDSRYASSHELTALATDLKDYIRSNERRGLQNEIRILDKERFELENIREQRRLTPQEANRLRIVMNEIERLKEEIRTIK